MIPEREFRNSTTLARGLFVSRDTLGKGAAFIELPAGARDLKV